MCTKTYSLYQWRISYNGRPSQNVAAQQKVAPSGAPGNRVYFGQYVKIRPRNVNK